MLRRYQEALNMKFSLIRDFGTYWSVRTSKSQTFDRDLWLRTNRRPSRLPRVNCPNEPNQKNDDDFLKAEGAESSAETRGHRQNSIDAQQGKSAKTRAIDSRQTKVAVECRRNSSRKKHRCQSGSNRSSQHRDHRRCQEEASGVGHQSKFTAPLPRCLIFVVLRDACKIWKNWPSPFNKKYRVRTITWLKCWRNCKRPKAEVCIFDGSDSVAAFHAYSRKFCNWNNFEIIWKTHWKPNSWRTRNNSRLLMICESNWKYQQKTGHWSRRRLIWLLIRTLKNYTRMMCKNWRRNIASKCQSWNSERTGWNGRWMKRRANCNCHTRNASIWKTQFLPNRRASLPWKVKSVPWNCNMR